MIWLFTFFAVNVQVLILGELEQAFLAAVQDLLIRGLFVRSHNEHNNADLINI